MRGSSEFSCGAHAGCACVRMGAAWTLLYGCMCVRAAHVCMCVCCTASSLRGSVGIQALPVFSLLAVRACLGAGVGSHPGLGEPKALWSMTLSG